MNQQVASLFELYLARSDLRPASVRFKRAALRWFVEWFGDLEASQVTIATAEDYRTMLVSAPSPRSGRKRSKRCANGYLANFKPFWRWLYEGRRIESNPFREVRLYRITKPKRETFAPDELGRMIKVASPLWKVRICLGLLGCRRGEMLNVVVRDINLSGQHPHILLQPKQAGANTWAWDLKSHAIRMVGLPEAMAVGVETVFLHREIVGLLERIKPGQPYVFLEEKYFDRMIARQSAGGVMDKLAADPTLNLQRQFRTLQRNAYVSPLRRYHELRAAFLTRMIRKYDLCLAAAAGGHSSTVTTMEYDRRDEELLVAKIVDLTKQCYVSHVP